MNPIISPKYRFISINAILLQEWLWHLIIHEGWHTIKKPTKPNQHIWGYSIPKDRVSHLLYVDVYIFMLFLGRFFSFFNGQVEYE